MANSKSTRRAWAGKINGAWRKAGDPYKAIGDDLIQAKKDLGNGEFGKMIKNDLEFSHSTAHRLMRVAGDERMRNCAHAHKLPAAWTGWRLRSHREIAELVTLGLAQHDAVSYVRQGLLAERSSDESTRRCLSRPLRAWVHRKTGPVSRLHLCLHPH